MNYFGLSVLVAVLLVLLDSRILLWLIIIFGQGHFLVSYFYLNKIGRINHFYVQKFLFFLFLFGLLCYFITYKIEVFNWFMFFTSMIFVLHYFYDELKILGIFPNRKTFVIFLPVAISFFVSYLVKYFDYQFVSFYPFLFLAGAMFVTGFKWIMQDVHNGVERKIFLFFYTTNFLTPLVCIPFQVIDMVKISGFIILFHYTRWYLYYFDKFKKMPDKKFLEEYLEIVFWINLLVVILFVLYSLSPKAGFLALLFNPLFFYGWTCLHIFMSIRKTDFQEILKL